MRTSRHTISRNAPADRRAGITGRAVRIALALAAASLWGCGDADAKKPAAGGVLAAPEHSTTTVAQFTQGAEATATAFTRDAGGKLLDDHLSPPPYVPIEPPPVMAEPVQRPKSKVESVNFEQLWQPPATPAERLVLAGERKLVARSLPLRDQPPLAASTAPLPLVPGLSAGPLLLAASKDVKDAGELQLSPPTPEALVTGDPASTPARLVANPLVAAGREGPAALEALSIPSPENHDLPVLPFMEAPPADADVYPIPGGRLLWSPLLPVPMPK